MKKNRLLAALLAGLLLLSLLSGCGGNNTGNQTSGNQANNSADQGDADAADSGELEGDIVFWHSFTQGPRMEKIQAAADEFMELHPKVNITIETFS